MPTSAKLGKCDMVLSISEDTINYQFSQLFKRNIIHHNWNIMIFEDDKGKIKDVLVNQSPEDFKKNLDDEEFDYAFNAQISSPTISILENERKVLTFYVSFSSGDMYYWVGHGHKSHIETADMKDWVYGFKVEIGKVQKDAKDTNWVTPESEDSFNQNCKDSGLNEELFSIESLFMDFENANYSQYDELESKVPTDIQKLAIFQNLLANYFKQIAETDNPFILGYGMKLKEVHQDALFTPTSLRYSTSYNKNSALRGFNFLMMIDGTEFPSGEDVGILPKSLITSKESTQSGVFAIDYTIFENKFLAPFIKIINKNIIKGFPSKDYTMDNQKWELSTELNDEDTQALNRTVTDSSLNSNISLYNETSSILAMETIIKYTLNIKDQSWKLFKFEYTTDKEAWYSTSGQYDKGPDNKHMGQEGKVNLSFEIKEDGKVTISDSFIQPYLGTDKKPKLEKGVGGDAAVLAAFSNSAFQSSAAKTSLDMFDEISENFKNTKKGLDDDIKEINNIKVILPLGNLYEFKDIQLQTKENVADNPILFKVNYSPKKVKAN